MTEATFGHEGTKEYTCVECGEKKVETYQYDGVINRINFDGFETGSSLTNDQTITEYTDPLKTAITGSGQRIVIKDTEDHTTGYGKCGSIILNSGSPYPKVKFSNAFGHLLTEEDVGKIYRISCWVKTDIESGINLSFGLLSPSAWDVCDNPPEGFVSFSGDYDYYQPTDSSHTTATVTTEWQQVYIDVTVTELMLSSHFGCLDRTRNGKVNKEYFNPALFSFKVLGYKECTIFIDDIETTYLGRHTEHEWGVGTITKTATMDEDGEKTFTCPVCGATKTESYSFDGIVSRIDFEDLSNGTALTNDQTLPE